MGVAIGEELPADTGARQRMAVPHLHGLCGQGVPETDREVSVAITDVYFFEYDYWTRDWRTAC
jgi:hypothetical protein